MIGEDTNCAGSADRHILDRAPEIEAVRDSGARLVSLASDEAVTRFTQLEVVMGQWRRTGSLPAETGPFTCFATRTSFAKRGIPGKAHTAVRPRAPIWRAG